jgi:hypothetical protein
MMALPVGTGGSATGLSATDAWRSAAAGDDEPYLQPFGVVCALSDLFGNLAVNQTEALPARPRYCWRIRRDGGSAVHERTGPAAGGVGSMSLALLTRKPGPAGKNGCQAPSNIKNTIRYAIRDQSA